MKRFDQINVIPFIDIMLVLLAIVLATATFIVQGEIPVRLSEAESTQAPVDEDPVLIAVDKQGAIFLDEAAVSLDELSTALSRMSQQTPIRVSVDSEASFTHFVQVVDRLNSMGLDRLSIATQGGGQGTN